ncbi:uncharacterized protein BJ212DRAFT_1241014, partial [Suillus subaureus]
ICCTGSTNWDMQERFQHSADTISKIFLHLLDMVVSPCFYQHYVSIPPNDIVPPEIHSNPKLYPFFQHCWGAIDGT